MSYTPPPLFFVGCRVTVNEIYRRTAGVQAEEASMSHELLSSIFITMSDSLSRPLISLHFWPIRGTAAAARPATTGSVTSKQH